MIIEKLKEREQEKEEIFNDSKEPTKRKLRKRINTLELENEVLKNAIKDELYKIFMKKLAEPEEAKRYKEDNIRLRKQIKVLKQIIKEELEAPGGEERADGHADIHQDHEARRQRAQDGQRRFNALVLDEHPGAGRLAGQGGGGLALQIVLLHDEHGQRDAQQHHGHSRRARLVVGAGDLQVDGGGQRVVGAADDHGVGKIGDGLDERHQEGVAQTGQHQRQRHAGEYLPAGGAHVPRRFLQRRVDVLQKSLQHHVAHREERQRLDDDDAPEAVHAVVINAQQEPGDDARLAEQHDHGQGQHEGRGDYRQHGHDLEKAAHKLVHADVDLHIGEQQADESGQNAHQKAHLQRVGNGAGKGRHLENALEDGKTEGAVSHKTIHQQYGQRVEDKQGQKRDQHDDGGDHDGIGHQLFPIQRRALCPCHR